MSAAFLCAVSSPLCREILHLTVSILFKARDMNSQDSRLSGVFAGLAVEKRLASPLEARSSDI